ncbi:MAG: class I adenylate-forming enzyme family protein [Dehalococcoidales bacterium]|nr:class I adenylate-forming enzyme family protein [Dehalococcoidales bacterium]
MLLSDLLSQNARLYPDDTALVELHPGKNIRKSITWREFDECANRVANALMTRGIKKGDKVIHLMMNSINWLVVYFGIIRTGAWAVPLNFRFTGKEIKYCVDIASAGMMILSEEFTERVVSIRSQLPTIGKYIFVGQNVPDDMEAYEEVLAKSSFEPPLVKIIPEDTCGLYFTSGTTGDPKPIVLTHKNMEFAAVLEQKHHHQTKDDNFILIPPLYHTGAKMHWFGSLIAGGRATILTEINPKNILEAVHEERGTIVWLLVPWAQDILVALDKGELKLKDYDLSQWRLMHIGAQPVPPSLVKRWKQYFPKMQYDTNYGLSESTGPGCIHLGIENERKVGAIGKAGYDWQARIVDDKGNDVLKGKNGEIIVKGAGVMKEYYKNPQKTAETLKDGWLYTGDIARMDEDGFIWLTDRKKDIIITGGENIFPVEIEEVLQSHQNIYDAAVIGIPDERLGEIAVAIIDPKPGMTLAEQEVLDFCAQNLAHFKRPRRIFFGKVSRNPTGKIEKPKLRERYSNSK